MAADSTLDQYIRAWCHHADGLRETADEMIAAVTQDFRYEDIHYSGHWEGAEGVREVCTIASTMYPGMKIEVVNRMVSHNGVWSMEWTFGGLHRKSGQSFRCNGASFGLLRAGRVHLQRDYWSLIQLESQTGPRL